MDEHRYPIDVVLWAISRHGLITLDDIRTRWTVSRATAYRWLEPLNDARRRALDIHPRSRVPTQTIVEKRTQ